MERNIASVVVVITFYIMLDKPKYSTSMIWRSSLIECVDLFVFFKDCGRRVQVQWSKQFFVHCTLIVKERDGDILVWNSDRSFQLEKSLRLSDSIVFTF